MFNNTIISVNTKMPPEMALDIAHRVKQRRLELNLTQAGLATRAGLKLPSYRKFERSGQISLMGLLYIAFALNMLNDFNTIFSQRQYQSIEEVIAESEGKSTRKRGKRK